MNGREREASIEKLLSGDADAQSDGANKIKWLVYVADDRAVLAQDARVVRGLVELLRTGNGDGKEHAASALAGLAKSSEAVQLEIVAALDGAACAVLETCEDTTLLPLLMKSCNPTLKARVAALRGPARLTALIKRSVDERNDELAAAAIDALNGLATAAELQDPVAGDEAVELCEETICVLAEVAHLAAARDALTRSTDGVGAYVGVLQVAGHADRAGDAKRLRAVLCLSRHAQQGDAQRAQVVAGGGVEVLIQCLGSELQPSSPVEGNAQLVSDVVTREILCALAAIAACGDEARSRIIAAGGLVPLILLASNPTTEQDGAVAVGVVEKFMENDQVRAAIFTTGGVPLLVQHLRHGTSAAMKLHTVAALNAALLLDRKRGTTSSTHDLLQVCADCGGIAELGRLLSSVDHASLRESVEGLFESVPEMVTRLIDAADAGSLATLEPFAERQKYQELIVAHGGITKMAALVRQADPGLTAVAARVLAKLAFENPSNCVAIAQRGVVPTLVTSLSSMHDELQVASAMALLSLASDPSVQNCIVLSGGGRRLTELMENSKSLKGGQVTAAWLGKSLAPLESLVKQVNSEWARVEPVPAQSIGEL